MLFNSYIFVLIFLPLALLLYFMLNHFDKNQLAKLSLIVMSLWFYAYFNIKYLPIIVISIVINYSLQSVFIHKPKESYGLLRKAILIVGIVLNIGILFYFKYFAFFVENINAVFKSDFVVERLILPLGISFFTFQQVTYLIDSYRDEVPRYSIVDYSLFVLFFPQLIAGPIVFHGEMIPQFQDAKNHRFNFDNFYKGIVAFSIGLAKKVLIADTFGNAVNAAFKVTDSLDTTNTLIIILAYTLQIYFDFSGYCDMAIGIGSMFNIKIPINFNSPYKALSIKDFWDRWHITLTRFFRTYVYIPIGGNRKGTARTCLNTLFVFFLSGLWHGANWTFILWGVFHGLGVVVNRLGKNIGGKIPAFFKWMVTFICINLLFILFRSDSVSQCMGLYQKLLTCDFGPIQQGILNAFKLPEMMFVLEKVVARVSLDINMVPYVILILFFVFSMWVVLFTKNTSELIGKRFKPTVWMSVKTAVLLAWSLVSFTGISTFLYFNF